MIQTGEEYKDRLRSVSDVYYKGEEIDDVTTHPATRGMVETHAELFDLLHDDEYRDELTYECPTTGEVVPEFYRRPESISELKARRNASRTWMQYTCGMSGRASDFLGAGLTGMAISNEHFNTDERNYGENVLEYYEYCRENNVSLTHALIDPQIDRSKSSSWRTKDDVDRPGAIRKVDETDEGIIVNGARMLSTLGPQAEELLVYPFGHFGENDEDEALAFAIPTDTDGLRQICRPSLSANDARNHPISSRFDEMDTFVIFDDVLVPWERVFINGATDIASTWYRYSEQEGMGTTYVNFAHYQTAIKDLAKAEFAFGVALLLAESTGVDEYFHVQSKLGEIGSMVENLRACIDAAEANAEEYRDTGYVVPDHKPLFGVVTSFPENYPRILEIIRDLGGSGLVGVPAWEDLEADAPLGNDVATYFRGKDMNAPERIAIQKLAYEVMISGFGGREELYERFYTGGPMRVKSNLFKSHPDKEEIKQRVLKYGWGDIDRPRSDT